MFQLSICTCIFQLCPAGWFTCETGGITCIDEAFQCDCSKDCDDGSDEDATYASCTVTQMASCKSSGGTQYCYLQFEKKMFATLSKLSDLHLEMYTYQLPDILGFCFYSDSHIFFFTGHMTLSIMAAMLPVLGMVLLQIII